MELNSDKKPSLYAAITTALVMGLIVLVCFLVKMYAPDPPIPEEGVEIALGYNEEGLGDNMPAATTPNYAAPSANSEYASQSTEESVSLNSGKKGSVTNPNAEPAKTETPNKEPEVNKNALFPGKKNPTSGGTGQGNTTGSGQQGDPNGTPGAQNYSGTPGSGTGYSLAGRKSVRLPEPAYNSNREGRIVVKIWVNRQGKVTKADARGQRGSTIAEESLIRMAETAALQATFTPSTTATETQTGTITYVFRRSN